MAAFLSLADCPASYVSSTDSQPTYIAESESGTKSADSSRTVPELLNATSIYSFTYLLTRHMASIIISALGKNQEILKLLFISGSIGLFRQLCHSLWQRFMSFFFLTAHIHHPDEAYSALFMLRLSFCGVATLTRSFAGWMMVWLSQQNNLTCSSLCFFVFLFFFFELWWQTLILILSQ